MPMPKITIGCDPELFVRNNKTGNIVSAWGLIPGDKKAPHPVKGGAIQVDGMAVEFNIDPVSTVEDWEANIKSVRSQLAQAVGLEYSLVCEPATLFDEAYFNSLPKEAKVVGCDPDFNAYTGKPNDRGDGQGQNLRMAAGHIHIGWTSGKDVTDVDHIADCIEVVKQLDFYVGLPSLVWDKDARRRQSYGAAGNFRVKPYGCEYRTPSNMWLSHGVFTNFVFNAAMAGVSDLFDGNAMRVSIGPNWAKDLCYRGRMDRDIVSVLVGRSKRLGAAGLRHMLDTAAALHAPKAPQSKAEEKVWEAAKVWGRPGGRMNVLGGAPVGPMMVDFEADAPVPVAPMPVARMGRDEPMWHGGRFRDLPRDAMHEAIIQLRNIHARGNIPDAAMRQAEEIWAQHDQVQVDIGFQDAINIGGRG